MTKPTECGVHYEQHPTRPELVAVCTLPKGHEGEHSNILGKVNVPADQRRVTK